MKGHFQVPFFYLPLTRIATTPSIVSLRNHNFDSKCRNLSPFSTSTLNYRMALRANTQWNSTPDDRACLSLWDLVGI